MLTYGMGPPGQYATPDGRLDRRRGRDGRRPGAAPHDGSQPSRSRSASYPHLRLDLLAVAVAVAAARMSLCVCLDKPVLLWAPLNWPLTAVNVLLNLRFSMYPLYIDWGALDSGSGGVGAAHGMGGGSRGQPAEAVGGR